MLKRKQRQRTQKEEKHQIQEESIKIDLRREATPPESLNPKVNLMPEESEEFYLEERKPGRATIEIDNTEDDLSDGLGKYRQRNYPMETIEDFAEKVGEDYESEEYRYIIPNLKHDTQQKLLCLEYGNKMKKILNMLDTIELTLKNNKYEPLENHPNMYRDEHQILEMIYCNKKPSRWRKFEDIEKEYYRINKLDKYDEEKRGKLLRIYDQLVENCSYISTSTSDSIEESSGEEKQVSSSPESEGKGVVDPSNNTTEAANVPKIELTDEEKEFAGKIALFAMELEPFQKLFSEMCTTLRYEYLEEWYRKISPAITDKLNKAEAKWLAGKIEIESSEEDFKSNDQIHWEDEYYAYLSNSENDEGRAEYFDKYQEAKNQLKEIRKEMEARKSSPPPTLTAKVTEPPASRSLYPELCSRTDKQTLA
ncbi:hypothetical protein JTB14_019137 [Gonioctena quinquepunctata]|nr:hypothetical protein JTB14_019137 [Gonioctena quinquepunctata]